MIIIITGKPRVGKTALNAFFLKQEERTQGRVLQKRACEKIAELNAKRTIQLAEPEQAPICSNFDVEFKIGYNKTFKSIWVNPFYIGLPNGKMPTLYLHYGSKIHITEGQRYYDSRESKTLPFWVSRFFETHGHFGFDIYIDVQRGKLIDINIRELSARFIEVQGMKHEYDLLGRVISTKWTCREWDNSQEYEEYIENGVKNYRTTTYENYGNIFNIYDPYSCLDDFVPKEGENFNGFAFVKKDGKVVEVDPKKYYSNVMPEEYRGKAAL